MQVISLDKIPNQQFEIILNNQDCTISLYVRGNSTYMDLTVDNNPIFLGAICIDRRLIRTVIKDDFIGNFIFIDKVGTSNPDYNNYNDRYIFVYLDEGEYV